MLELIRSYAYVRQSQEVSAITRAFGIRAAGERSLADDLRYERQGGFARAPVPAAGRRDCDDARCSTPASKWPDVTARRDVGWSRGSGALCAAFYGTTVRCSPTGLELAHSDSSRGNQNPAFSPDLGPATCAPLRLFKCGHSGAALRKIRVASARGLCHWRRW